MTTTMTDTTVTDIAAHVRDTAQRAREAAQRLANTTNNIRNATLERIAMALERSASEILRANASDVTEARAAVERGELTSALVDRLVLNPVKLDQMIASVRAVAALNDPIGRLLARTRLDDGLELHKVAVPLGVVAAIFEARPDAVTQIATLALKSGNAAILKGGSEAARTTRVLVQCMRDALGETHDIPPDAITSVEGRAAVDALLGMDDVVDLIIPRGSTSLVQSVQSRTRIPVLGHAEGVCHVYLHATADAAMAAAIVTDSKAQYPSACNAAETLLVDAAAAPALLPPVFNALSQAGVEIRGCGRTLAVTRELELPHTIVPATADDWATEYGALIISCRLVENIRDAVAHINTYGSRHTDAIVATDAEAAKYFLTHVDSAGVYHNASTRFADGYRYGFGAEVGVSTSKLHARGPVGLEGLTTYKYVLHGSGQIVATYSGASPRPFSHQTLPI